MSRTPSDCIDHGNPHLFYITTEGQGEPITLTIVETEGGKRNRYQIPDARWLLVLSEVLARVAGRAR